MVSPKVGAALRDVKPVMALVLEKIVFAGVGIVYKLAFAGGMKVDILVFYRMLFAAIAIAPLAFLIERYISHFYGSNIDLSLLKEFV